MIYKCRGREKEYHKEYHQKNKKKHSEYCKEYYLENKKEIKKRKIKHYQTNREEINRKRRIKYHSNKEKNKEKLNEYKKKYFRKRYYSDLKYKLNRNISRVISRSLKDGKGGRHWEKPVGYTLNDLVKHLKKTLPEGFTWQDYLDGKLHIDHKIPIYAFNFDSYDDLDFKKCFALKNLRLLEATKNLRKNKKLNKPFQPSLKL